MAEKFEIRRFILRDAASILSLLLAVSVVFGWVGNFWIKQNRIEDTSISVAEIKREIEQLRIRIERHDLEIAVLQEKFRK